MTHDASQSASAGHRSQRLASNLEQVLPRMLGEADALPEDWHPEATTYDLDRFHSEAQFDERFAAAVQEMVEHDLREPAAIRALLTACGHGTDYARLGQPLSRVFELYLQWRTGAARAVSFASRTAPLLSVIGALPPAERSRVRVYVEGRLPLSPGRVEHLRRQGVELFDGWTRGAAPRDDARSIVVHVREQRPAADTLRALDADAVCWMFDEGGVLLLRDDETVDVRRVQLLRKRTVAALLAANARAELMRFGGLAVADSPRVDESECRALVMNRFPLATDAAFFCTGLAAEAAVFTAAARALDPAHPVHLFHAQNGYGGTCQLIADVLAPEHVATPGPLPVVEHAADGRLITLVDQFVEQLPRLAGAPAILFLEMPTNPELQLHDFVKLGAALEGYRAEWGVQIPVLVDTTFAPLYALFAQPFARDWPVLIVKSGSKYLTKGKATLGVAITSSHPLAKRIMTAAREYGEDEDSLAKPSQLAALAEGLRDLDTRMARIAANTAALARRIREELRSFGHDIVLYGMTERDVANGLASGIVSFYLPPAKTDKANLVDEFVEYLLVDAPNVVKNRVSYGQSASSGEYDPFYVINPQESTQGSLPLAVKQAQMRGAVQICRISVPEKPDTDRLIAAMRGFFAMKYS